MAQVREFVKKICLIKCVTMAMFGLGSLEGPACLPENDTSGLLEGWRMRIRRLSHDHRPLGVFSSFRQAKERENEKEKRGRKIREPGS